jgi:hypothetical protein
MRAPLGRVARYGRTGVKPWRVLRRLPAGQVCRSGTEAWPSRGQDARGRPGAHTIQEALDGFCCSDLVGSQFAHRRYMPKGSSEVRA